MKVGTFKAASVGLVFRARLFEGEPASECHPYLSRILCFKMC